MAIPQKGPVQATQEVNKVTSTVVIGAKKTVTAGTAVALVATATPLKNGVKIHANSANTGNVAIGLTGVTMATGYVLAADEYLDVPIADLHLLFLNSAVNAEGVSFIGN